MAESKVLNSINRPASSESPPPNCAICLGSFTNKCFSNSCMHQFCFTCLLEWSKIKPECPLCKQPFKKIIHNVKSNTEYDEHTVDIPHPDEVHIIDNEEFLYLALSGGPRHHFHFRTTFTVDTRGEHAIQQMLLTHPLMGNGGQISIGGIPSRSDYMPRRRRDNTTTGFRRSIYLRNLWVETSPDLTGRYREVSPGFFRNTPGARTRLVPWLNRELNALLYENTQLVMHLVDIILEQLTRVHICSGMFRRILNEYLDNKTDHFIHEFYHFMRSPYDMIGYDRNVRYNERPTSPLPFVVDTEDNNSDDSDVIVVGTLNPQEPVVIDLVNTDSDEPILVSHTTNATTTSTTSSTMTSTSSSQATSTATSESRPPILPLKLRLKHKRQSREKEKSQKGGSKRSKRSRRSSSRRRSSSGSSSSSSSSSGGSASSREDRRRRLHARRKRQYRSSRYLDRIISTSESNVNVDSSSSDSDDVPLSALAAASGGKRKRRSHNKSAFKRSFSTILNSSREEASSASPLRGYGPCATASAGVDLDAPGPSCSRYNLEEGYSRLASGIGLDLRVPMSRVKDEHGGGIKREVKEENGLDLRTNNGRRGDEAFGPSCSRYTHSHRSQGSSSDELPNHSKSASSSSSRANQNKEPRHKNKRHHPYNICIKKEKVTNRWYTLPNNYDSSSASD